MDGKIKRLSLLRDELRQIQFPEYPDDFWLTINRWIYKAMPTIKKDWADFFQEFKKVTAKPTNRTRVVYYSGTIGIVSKQEHKRHWMIDCKEAEEVQQKTISFLDGILLISSNSSESTSKSKKNSDIAIGGNITNGTVISGSNNTIHIEQPNSKKKSRLNERNRK